jgi:TatD DNase family protein
MLKYIVSKRNDKMIVDTHLHLNTEAFKDDLDQVIKNANDQDVKKLIVIGMDHKTSKQAIDIAENHEGVYVSVGLHPGYVDEGDDSEFIHHYVNHKKVVAIGETGLDFYWTKENKDLQIKRFVEHIELSIKYHLPLVIHTRNSFQETYDLLKPYEGKAFGVFHCFSSNLIDAKKAIDLGFYIGIDGPITFKNPKELLPIVENIDLKHILIETDSPYLAPTPFRGKRNEPKYLVEVVKKIAEIKNMTEEEVKDITTRNAHQLFKLGGMNHED